METELKHRMQTRLSEMAGRLNKSLTDIVRTATVQGNSDLWNKVNSSNLLDDFAGQVDKIIDSVFHHQEGHAEKTTGLIGEDLYYAGQTAADPKSVSTRYQ